MNIDNYCMRISITQTIIFVISITILYSDDHNINVNGTVYRNGTTIPLQGANVLFVNENGAKFGSSSDLNGRYSISDVPAGNYTVTISFIGYADYQKSVIIESG